MNFNLYLPFPIPSYPGESSANDLKKKKDKGKAKAFANANPNAPATTVDRGAGGSGSLASANGFEGEGRGKYWTGLERDEREKMGRVFGLAGHLGYNVLGCTITSEPSPHVIPCPWRRSEALPFPDLDPRNAEASSSSSSAASASASASTTISSRRSTGGKVVQVTRFHMRLDDMKTHCFSSSNTSALKDYDILSVSPTSEKALQLACTDLSLPGPNQISIISLPLHEKPYHFRLNRRQIRQAQRNGVMFELLYAPLFPPPHVSSETARRWRQNVISNAREVIRITEGKGIILSSGPGGGEGCLRGPIDLINLACVLGMPANLAKDALSLNGKMVLLRAQARRTFKGVFGMPQIVVPPSVPHGNSLDDSDGDNPVQLGDGKEVAMETKRLAPEGINEIARKKLRTA